MSRTAIVDGYSKGVDDGIDILLVNLIARAERGGSLSVDDLRRILADLIEIRLRR